MSCVALSRAVLVAILISLAQGPAHAEPASLAAEVKATYLEKFGDFVEWPDAAFAGPSDPIRLCVIGSDPFGAVLDQASHGQRIGAHPLVLVRLDKIERAPPCHILFAAGSSKQSIADVLDKVRGAPVLTITDGAGNSAAHGIINFVVVSDRIRFQIDEAAAMQSGLAISSKLLSLAIKSVG